MGVRISEYMKWDERVRSLSSSFSKFFCMIKSLKDVTSPYLIKSIYLAYLHAHLRYGVVFWGSVSKSKITFKLQKWASWMISGVRRCMSYGQLFKFLNILPVPCLYMPETICHINYIQRSTAVRSCEKSHLHVQLIEQIPSRKV